MKEKLDKKEMFDNVLDNIKLFTKNHWKKVTFWLSVFAVLCSLVWYFQVWLIEFYQGHEWGSTLESFTISLIASFAAVLVGVNSLQRYIDATDRKKKLGNMKDFWEVEDPKAGFVIVFGGQIGDFLDDEPTVTSEATMRSLAKLMAAIMEVHGSTVDIFVENYVDFKKAEHGNRNLVLLGGYLSVPPVEDIAIEASFPYRQNLQDSENRLIIRSGDGVASVERKSERKIDSKSKPVLLDWAFIAKVQEVDVKKTAFFFSGNYGAGTYAAVLAATSRDAPYLNCKTHPGGSKQWIIEARNVTPQTLRQSDLKNIHVETDEEFNAEIDHIFTSLDKAELIGSVDKVTKSQGK
jgi:hypothetical protein